jgi:adenylate kinase
VYRQQTAIVADYYSKQNKYSAINGLGTMDEVFARLTDVIDAKR